MKDLTGLRFGILTVVGFSHRGKNGKPVWECVCDCGNATKKVGAYLLRGDTTSCGCQHYAESPQVDLTGNRFGRLTVKEYIGGSKWLCLCDCGKTVKVKTDQLNRGATKSCGCYRVEKLRQIKTKHGGCHDALYAVLSQMHYRCENENSRDYKWYGAEGKTVCAEWDLNNYGVFREWAEKNGYRKGLTIDRIDPNKGYSPGNCRWVTIQEQQSNKRNTKGGHKNGEA